MTQTDITLEVKDLCVEFRTTEGTVQAVDHLSYVLHKGEKLGIVGESGSGKSVSSLGMMQLIPSPPGQITRGEILHLGRDLVRTSERDVQKIRGNEISMIFQEPMTSLNPIIKCGKQIAESLCLHRGMKKKEAMEGAIRVMKVVGIVNPEVRAHEYPHQMSGGMGQRVMVAMALACQSQILIADESTTALGVIIQAQILDLIREMNEELHSSILFITHNLGVVNELCDTAIVTYTGHTVEQAPAGELFRDPKHPYIIGLLNAIPVVTKDRKPLSTIEGMVPNPTERVKRCSFWPRCPHAIERCRTVSPPMKQLSEERKARCWLFGDQAAGKEAQCVAQNPDRDINESINEDENNREVLVRADHVEVYFKGKDKKSGTVEAMDDVNFHIMKGETFGVVGKSGCGKSTPGRALVRLLKPTEDHIYTGGTDIAGLKGADLKKMHRKVQIIFQGPSACLSPRRTVRQILMEPFEIHGTKGKMGVEARIMKLFNLVGLDLYCLGRYPHELSGGQKQYISTARALALESDIIICDGTVSALDVSVQAQVLNLLRELKEKLGLTYFLISHNLDVIYQVSDRVGVIYLGNMAEVADCDKLHEKRHHPYMEALLSVVPQVDQGVKTERIHPEGEVPSPSDPPSGYRFHTRCPKTCDRCRQEVPRLKEVAEGHFVACHLYQGLTGLKILV